MDRKIGRPPHLELWHVDAALEEAAGRTAMLRLWFRAISRAAFWAAVVLVTGGCDPGERGGVVEESTPPIAAAIEAAAKQKAAKAGADQAEKAVNSLRAKWGEIAGPIAQTQAEVTSADVLLSHTRLLAPIAGIVTMKSVDVGDLAAPGTPLLNIEDDEQLRLEVMVDMTTPMHRLFRWETRRQSLSIPSDRRC
jgi:membrane fusion protein, multidrug efflux system